MGQQQGCRVTLLISATFGLALLGAQDRRPPEPETLGILYHLDLAAGTLAPLERQVARVRLGVSRWMFGVGGASAEISGERSPFRLTAGQKPEFVVRLAVGVDPNKFVLYLLQRKKGKRTIRYGASGLPEDAILCRVTKSGEFSYKITPDQELTPGEYCFSPRDTNDVFAFGLDAPQRRLPR